MSNGQGSYLQHQVAQNTSIKEKSSWSHTIGGGIAGCVSSILTQPFDVVKTKMIGTNNTNSNISAVSIQSIQSLNVYKKVGLISSLKTIYSAEGLKGLWRGTVPTFWRVLPGSAVYYTLINESTIRAKKFKQNLNPTATVDLNIFENFIVGGTSRFVATSLVNPITVIKTRFELSNHPNQKQLGMLASVKEIYRMEGLRGLYTGIIATLSRDVPQSGIIYSSFKYTKDSLHFLVGEDKSQFSSWITFFSGFISGVIGVSTTHPFDVIRTRMQLNSNYNGVIHAFSTIAKEEGIKGLFRGVIPRICKRSLASAISWTTLEFIVQLNQTLQKNNSDTSNLNTTKVSS